MAHPIWLRHQSNGRYPIVGALRRRSGGKTSVGDHHPHAFGKKGAPTPPRPAAPEKRKPGPTSSGINNPLIRARERLFNVWVKGRPPNLPHPASGTALGDDPCLPAPPRLDSNQKQAVGKSPHRPPFTQPHQPLWRDVNGSPGISRSGNTGTAGRGSKISVMAEKNRSLYGADVLHSIKRFFLLA